MCVRAHGEFPKSGSCWMGIAGRLGSRVDLPGPRGFLIVLGPPQFLPFCDDKA